VSAYVDVILPLPLQGTFTYTLPAAMADEVKVGCRVVVSFGQKKFYTAIVSRIHDERPAGDYEIKPVSILLDATPVVTESQLRFWRWIADYYLCSVGDVYKAALPSGLKLESESVVEYNPEFEAESPLPAREQQILDLLSADEVQSVTRLEKESGLKNILPVIKSLLERGAIFVKEEIKHNYKPRVETRVRFSGVPTERQLNVLFDTLRRAQKQLDLLMRFVELSGYLSGTVREVSKKQLLDAAHASDAVLKGLVEKRILEFYQVEVGRLSADADDESQLSLKPLSAPQQRAMEKITACFREKNVCLLHGVTSSGKTEVYIHLIDEVLRQGRQVLYLLPEIALTAQITARLRAAFGSRLGVYHSKFPDAERVEIWRKQLSDSPYEIIVGVRSSIFLPFSRLGLVIVDEEHENTYKQQDPAPRYNARNGATVLASMAGAKVLLGSATPSIDSWYNASRGKYGLVTMTERYQEIKLPEILPVDIKELRHKKRMAGQFSPMLLQMVREALSAQEQVILFQNRRGFAPMVECRTCGWVPRCKNCDVSLTYHRGINQLTCHYCGYTYPVPKACPACGGTEVVSRGFGTEKVEDDIKMIFPEASVARMDLDTTRTRSAYERIIADFERGKTNILIGTQMVSKGLDFDNVSVVGILNADTMLNYPDFRAYERAFQLMAQVAGRAGRKGKQGRVVLQTRDISHPIISQVIGNRYNEMVESQLAERQMFRFPPYYRLIYVYLKHRDEALLDRAAETMAAMLRGYFASRVLGPDKPPVARIQTLFIKKIVLKVETTASMERARELLLAVQRAMLQDPNFKSLMVYYDVDPM
jgi:primosomal protein N' (replication factor Y)